MLGISLFSEYLTHTVTVEAPRLSNDEASYDQYGEPIQGGAGLEQVNCFVDMSVRRSWDSTNKIQIKTIRVLFENDFKIGIDWRITNAQTPQGDILFIRGRVTSVDNFIDPDEGIIGRQVTVELQ